MRRVVASAFALAMLASPALALDEPVKLYFFSPDFSPANLSILTQAADAYFRETGAKTRFQAFVRFADFKRELAAQKPQFVVVPAWASGVDCVGTDLRALAKPMRGGDSSGRKALVARPTVANVGAIAKGTIAATVPPGGSLPGSAVERIRRAHPDIKIIAVPKEIDALLAVAFGQVDAAYVSVEQFALLAGVSPNLGTDLREIGYAESTPFPMIYATAHATEEQIARLRSAVVSVDRTGTGKRLLGLLGYDRWVHVDGDEERAPATVTPCGTPSTGVQ